MSLNTIIYSYIDSNIKMRAEIFSVLSFTVFQKRDQDQLSPRQGQLSQPLSFDRQQTMLLKVCPIISFSSLFTTNFDLGLVLNPFHLLFSTRHLSFLRKNSYDLSVWKTGDRYISLIIAIYLYSYNTIFLAALQKLLLAVISSVRQDQLSRHQSLIGENCYSLNIMCIIIILNR